MKIYKCALLLHDFIFFASRDLAKIAMTEKVIHNSALNYAINYFSRIINFSSEPHYDKDFALFSLRATPAKPTGTIPHVAFSYNAVNDLDLSTEATGNLPKVGKYYKFSIGARKIAQSPSFEFSAFQFFVFSFRDYPPPRVIRVGKKESYCLIKSDELQKVELKEATRASPIQPDHPVNPQETPGEVIFSEPLLVIFIPPTPLFMKCKVSGPHLQGVDNNGKRVFIIPPADKIEEVRKAYAAD